MLKLRKERSFKNQSCLLLSTDVLGFAELEEKFVGIGGVRLVGNLAGRQFALPHVLAHQLDLARVQMDLLHQLVVLVQLVLLRPEARQFGMPSDCTRQSAPVGHCHEGDHTAGHHLGWLQAEKRARK